MSRRRRGRTRPASRPEGATASPESTPVGAPAAASERPPRAQPARDPAPPPAGELPQSDRRGRDLTLEIELSYAAGTAASAGATAWFLFGYCQEVGFETIGQLLLSVVFFSLIEAFAGGLTLYLLYRGAWMAATLFARNDPARWSEAEPDGLRFREGLRDLDRACRSLFYWSFHTLKGGMVGVAAQGALYLYFADQGPWSQTVGLVGMLAFVAGSTLLGLTQLFGGPALQARVQAAFERAGRWVGVWWVSHPIESRVRPPGVLAGLASAVGFFGLVYSNIVLVAAPHLRTDQDVYSRARDHQVVFHFRLGGVRGDVDSQTRWNVLTALRPLPEFRRLDLNHFVAVVPLSGIEPGVHELKAGVRIMQRRSAGSSESSFVLLAQPQTVRFLVTD